MTFVPSAKRLLGRLRPERLGLLLVTVLAVLSVAFSVLGPKLLGEGTNLIFEGFISKSLPAGATKAEVLQQLRESGDTDRADLLSGIETDGERDVIVGRTGRGKAAGDRWYHAVVPIGVGQRNAAQLPIGPDLG